MPKNSRLKNGGLLLIKLLGTLAFLYWAFRHFEDPTLILECFKKAIKEPNWFLLGLFFSFSAVIAEVFRLYFLTRAQSLNGSIIYTIKMVFVASLFNMVSIGGIAGDSVKVIGLLRKNLNKKISISLVIMMDHVIGFVAIGSIFLSVAWSADFLQNVDNEYVKNIFHGVSVFLIGGMVMIVLMFVFLSQQVFGKLKKKFKWLASRQHLATLVTCMNLYRSKWKYTIGSLVSSIFLYLFYFCSFYAAVKTIYDQVELSMIFTVMPIVDMACALPVSISGLGVREKTFDYLLNQLTEIPSEVTVSASLIGFVFHSFCAVVGGLYFLISGKSRNVQIDNYVNSQNDLTE